MRPIRPCLFKNGAVFQSTHPRGMRLITPVRYYTTLLFQSTHPRGMRLDFLREDVECFEISIHASAWDATGIPYVPVPIFKYFNPRIRVGCDHYTNKDLLEYILISIHASAWDATFQAQRDAGMSFISIHASAWDATIQTHSSLYV